MTPISHITVYAGCACVILCPFIQEYVALLAKVQADQLVRIYCEVVGPRH